MPDASLPNRDALTYAFAPIHKTAFGLAVGFVAGLIVVLVTAFHVIAQPVDGPNLKLLAQYFYGYRVSWTGALVGGFWAGVAGFVAGWFLAFVRNLVLSLGLFAIKSESELERTAHFLDHI